MRNLFLLLCFVTVFLFASCYDGRLECFDSKKYVSVSFISTSNVDSVQFYLNEQRICYGRTGVDEKHVMCKDSTEKIPFFVLPSSEIIPDSCVLRKDEWICQKPSDFLSVMYPTKINLDNCVLSEEYPIWNGFHCLVGGPSDTINVDSGELSVHIFSQENRIKIQSSLISFSGNQINIIPEQDTTKWFSYVDNPTRPEHEAFVSPAASNRVGCFDGYCVATLPMMVKEFCYDKFYR